MTEAKLKIFEEIPKIAAEIGGVKKAQQNKQQGFSFRGIDDVYNSVSLIMAKHGVFSVCTILNSDVGAITSKQGAKGYHMVNHYEFTFYASDGSSVKQEAIGEAMDYGDKAANKCFSIAHKYALLGIFAIPTEETLDPDSTTPPAVRPETKAKPKHKTLESTLGKPSDLTTDDITRLYTVMENKKIKKETIKAFCLAQMGNENPNHLSKKDFDEFTDMVEDSTLNSINGAIEKYKTEKAQP